MGRELPGVCHLVQDQPTPQILTGQVGLLRPLLDIGLDQVKPVGSDRLGAQELRVELAEDSVSQETEHEADIPVDSGATRIDAQRVGDAAQLAYGIDDAAEDGEAEIEPALAVDGFEPRHLNADRKPADAIEQRLLGALSHLPVKHSSPRG